MDGGVKESARCTRKGKGGKGATHIRARKANKGRRRQRKVKVERKLREKRYVRGANLKTVSNVKGKGLKRREEENERKQKEGRQIVMIKQKHKLREEINKERI